MALAQLDPTCRGRQPASSPSVLQASVFVSLESNRKMYKSRNFNRCAVDKRSGVYHYSNRTRGKEGDGTDFNVAG